MPPNFWSKVKFFLGMECIAKYGEQFVVTKREFGSRVCLDRKSEFWWMEGYWNRHCTYDTIEGAEKRICTMNPPPERLKLTVM